MLQNILNWFLLKKVENKKGNKCLFHLLALDRLDTFCVFWSHIAVIASKTLCQTTWKILKICKILVKCAAFKKTWVIGAFTCNLQAWPSVIYSCTATVVTYTCITTRSTRVNTSVQNTFIECLYLQVGLYTCNLRM